MLQTVTEDKVDEKNWVISLFSMFPSWIVVLKLSKKVYFLQFCADLSKKSKSTEVIHIYASESSRYALSENGIVYYAMTYRFGDIRVWSRIILLNFCWVSIFFNILIANTSWKVTQIPINNIIFWKSVMRRCIYVNCCDRWGFLLRSAQNCKKCTLLDNLSAITQEGDMETRQMASFFPSTFAALTVPNIHSCIRK